MKKIEQQAVELGAHLERFMIYIVQIQQKSGFEDLNKQETNLLFYLGTHGPSIMRELAESLRLHVSTMTGIIDKLIEKGFVERGRSDEDRRIVRVNLTEKGLTAYQSETEKRKQLSLKMLNSLAAEERETMLQLFSKVTSELEK